MIPEVKEIENDAIGDLKSYRSDQDDADDHYDDGDRNDDGDHNDDDNDHNDDDGDHNNDGFNSICVPRGRWQR